MAFHALFQKGHLPDPGAITQQSHRGLKLLQITEHLVERAQREKAEADSRRRGRS